MFGNRPIRWYHVVGVWALVYFPWLPGFPLNRIDAISEVPFAWVVDANLAAEYALIAFSLVILTGWVGQISLGHAAFVGIGAFATGLLSRNWGVPFPVSLPIALLLSAAAATLLGVVALRVRGLYLAVATLIFAWICDAYLFTQSWFIGEGGAASIPARIIGDPEGMTNFDLANDRVLYLILLAAVAAAWLMARNLRMSKTGRAFFAIRGSEMAAVSLGIDVIKYKLLAFAISGALAGLAGNLIMVDLRSASPQAFQFNMSLFYLGIAVVGGITSLGGAVASGVLFAALTEVFFRVSWLDGWLDIVTAGLLLGVLIGYPGGLGALGAPTRQALGTAWTTAVTKVREGRAAIRGDTGDGEATTEGESEAASVATAGDGDAPRRSLPRLRLSLPGRKRVARRTIDLARIRAQLAEPSLEEIRAIEAMRTVPDWRNHDVSAFKLAKQRGRRPLVLEAEHVTVQFGGLVAVDDVSLQIREHEIVGLIGPNGAGKTTTFNAIAGLNEPTSGTIRLFGEDVTDFPVHLRAQMGVGRTFQLIQLFSQLTVFDNLLVATHNQNETGVLRHLVLSDKAVRAEKEARERVRFIVELMGLEDVVDRPIAGLPFGILRQVEIARALVTEAPLLMLDEAASGLDNAETDELMQLLYYLRAELGVSILLIEHDVRMVTQVCDYMYVLNRGRLLAEGVPSAVQSNREVVAAYLGEPEPALEGA